MTRGKAPSDTGTSRCWKIQRERRAAGLCVKCGKAPGDPHCAVCREINTAYDKRRRKERKEAGLCQACTNVSRPGKSLCADCQAKVTVASRKNRARKAAEGGCALCCGVGAVATVGKVCWRCWLRERAYTALGNANDWEKLDELWKAQGARCAYTGELLVAGVNASLDHIIPRARGGSLTIDNVHWVTLTVNLAKRELTNDEFFALCRRVVAVADARASDEARADHAPPG